MAARKTPYRPQDTAFTTAVAKADAAAMSAIHSSLVRVVSIASIRRASMVICLTSFRSRAAPLVAGNPSPDVVLDGCASTYRRRWRRRDQYREPGIAKRYQNRAGPHPTYAERTFGDASAERTLHFGGQPLQE